MFFERICNENLKYCSEIKIFLTNENYNGKDWNKSFTIWNDMLNSKNANSITKGVYILKSLSDGIGRISDLSSELSLSKGTVHRLLKTLGQLDLVMQDPITRRYYLGPLILKLASKPIIAHQKLITCAFDQMRYLRDVTRETVVIHIRVGLERICLEELQSLETVRYTAGKGFVMPLYAGAGGKVLLSEIDENELQLLLRNLRLVSLGPNTITDRKMLLKEIRRVRQQGFATSFGEREQGSSSISVPIKNYICPVALSILGPDNRFTLKKMTDILKEVKESAGRISENLAK